MKIKIEMEMEFESDKQYREFSKEFSKIVFEKGRLLCLKIEFYHDRQ